MSKFSTIIWECYILLITLILAGKYQSFFGLDEAQNNYFHILIAFDQLNLTFYYTTLIQILINIIHLIPLTLYVFRQSYGPAIFWQTLFLGRIFFDIIGHNYELNEIYGLFHGSTKVGLLFCVAATILWAPSYIACYLYAFKTPKKV